MQTRSQLISTVVALGGVALFVIFPQFCRRMTPPDRGTHFITESEQMEADARVNFIMTSFARFRKLDSLGGTFRFKSDLPDSIQQDRAQEAVASYREAERLMNAIIYAIPTADTSHNYWYKRACLLREFCRSKINMIKPNQHDTERFRYAMQVDSLRKIYQTSYDTDIDIPYSSDQ